MAANNLISIEAKAFVPARDFELCKRFYEAIGFALEFSEGDLAEFRHGSSSFLLQHYYVKEHTESFMMHLLVEDVDRWYDYVSVAAAPFGVRVGKPEDQPWGLRDFTLFDPSGVLWRIAQVIPAKS